MKRTLSFITTIVIALCPVPMFAQETTAERIKEKSSEALETTKKKANEAAKTVSEKSKEAWRKTKAYLSQDPQTYRDGANQRLEELGSQIGKIEAESKDAELASRSYFDTRLKALGEHHEFAEKELSDLPRGEDFAHARKQLDYTIDQLETAADQAQSEVRNFRALTQKK